MRVALGLLAWLVAASADYLQASPGIQELKTVACAQEHVTDKMSGGGYELMYGTFLWPLRQLAAPKILEIGLGCNQGYGPGASAKLWRVALPNAQLWEAEYDGACVEKWSKTLDAGGIRVLVGNQSDKATLTRWVEAAGTDFSAIIDDGSHRNGDILASFHFLWPHVAPGGYYFIEDLYVGRNPRWDDTGGEAVVADVIGSWTEQLLNVFRRYGGAEVRGPRPANERAATMARKFPLPPRVAFIHCQAAACLIAKKKLPHSFGHTSKCPKPASSRPTTKVRGAETAKG